MNDFEVRKLIDNRGNLKIIVRKGYLSEKNN